MNLQLTKAELIELRTFNLLQARLCKEEGNMATACTFYERANRFGDLLTDLIAETGN